MVSEIAQQSTQRAELLKLGEDKPHHRLGLLVGVELDGAVGVPHVPTGQRKREGAAARFTQAALVEPLLEQMQLSLTHGPLESQ
jgi:hypothetical protein